MQGITTQGIENSADAPRSAPIATRAVRSGLIVATLAQMRPSTAGNAAENAAGNGDEIRAPLTFDGDTVVEDGAWPLNPGEDAADALTRIYVANFEAWCARTAEKAKAEREQDEQIHGPKRQARRPTAYAHVPCPALWAGR